MATAGETYFFLGGTRCGVHTILDSRPISLDRLSLHEKKSIYTVTSPFSDDDWALSTCKTCYDEQVMGGPICCHWWARGEIPSDPLFTWHE